MPYWRFAAEPASRVRGIARVAHLYPPRRSRSADRERDSLSVSDAPSLGAAARADAAPVQRSRRAYLRRPGKRAGDVALAALLLICLWPLLVIVALAVRADSPGPVLFRQRRIGRGGHDFTVLKFRSMAADASHDAHWQFISELALRPAGATDGSLLKLTEDLRVTRVGAIIRKLSIDELPQLLNVLVGDMAIVGPRPAVAYELDLYRAEHFERFTVRPGLTGLWQVSGRNRLGLYDMLDLDVEYVRDQRPGRDLRIILRTPLAVLRANTA